jgi:hypothetical protein
MAPAKVNRGDIVLYPKVAGGDDVDRLAWRLIGDVNGFRVIERGSNWIRLEPIYPDLDDFPHWLEEVSKFIDSVKVVWKPLFPGSFDGYWKMATYSTAG